MTPIILKSAKFWDEVTGNYLGYFIPCYRKSDNEVGLYDIVTNTFFEHSGDKEFIAGPNVTEHYSTNLSWSSTVGTIYGGYVDLVNGEIVQEWQKINISDLQWNNYSAKIHYYAYLPAGPSRETESFIYSNLLTPRTNGGFAQENIGEFTYHGFGTVNHTQAEQYKRNIWTKLPEAMEMTEANNWIKTNYSNAYIVYKLATPITYPINSQTLQTLRGANNIWASNNGGNIEVSFWRH